MYPKLVFHFAFQDCDGDTPLHDAISGQNLAMVELLLSDRADLTITNSLGHNCLHHGALSNVCLIVLAGEKKDYVAKMKLPPFVHFDWNSCGECKKFLSGKALNTASLVSKPINSIWEIGCGWSIEIHNPVSEAGNDFEF
ncbi:unnamed protein product [Dibothriocephalus latus]|uniref:Uncharacterized protein n=1 Tax=Dibothriocephalus latus TaxID=60516 RepID=A0A3P7NSK9_DIBLA|nr:unnamed protein product [Dibothriocephalus latus]